MLAHEAHEQRAAAVRDPDAAGVLALDGAAGAVAEELPGVGQYQVFGSELRKLICKPGFQPASNLVSFARFSSKDVKQAQDPPFIF